ncbi:hypothetical protein [Tianweitania sediminis]|jgi:hypothetical protein|uniref:Uncharacterized protein n=1 Tax=Tianweitania sediminis TaxID=1502156 RepID=A0A8J7R0J0_9HYPH|nr:hypothetical protein [Tianweitania sediminis]MBP0438842.1 hypothetical protein [Tianweitania sediminis]HEV7414637.1 hypothetical protein [Tianweitania sediminis]
MTTSPELLSEINHYVDDAAAHGQLLIPVKECAAALAPRFSEKPLVKIEEKIRDRIRAKDLYPVG